jgi:hypothetical protein
LYQSFAASQRGLHQRGCSSRLFVERHQEAEKITFDTANQDGDNICQLARIAELHER